MRVWNRYSFTSRAGGDRRRALLEAAAIGVLVATVVFAAIAGLWTFAQKNLEENYRTQLTALAQSAAILLDPELQAGLRRTEQTDAPQYHKAIEPLRRMREGVPGIRFVYTLARDGDDIHVVLDSAEPSDQDGNGAGDRSPIGAPGRLRQPAKLAALGLPGIPARAGATDAPYQDGAGVFMTGYAPFLDERGHPAGLVGVDVDASDYLAHLEQGRMHMLQGLLPAGVLILALTYGLFILRWRALASARRIKRGAKAAQLAARQDKLTGLANRTACVERLQAAVDAVRAGLGEPFAVLFLDFDHFKFVNDTLGHDAGDELLRQIAQRLGGAIAEHAEQSDMGANHLAARLGGDEFVILLDRVGSEVEARKAADRFIRMLAPSYLLRGVDVVSTASIGVALSGNAPDDPELLLHNADVAMYEAKRSGRACHVLFDDAMRARLTRVLQLERGLLRAIGTGEIRLAYQPIIELETGRMVSVEALLRWNHPVLGEVLPSEFVSIAEEAGLMVSLGDWVLHEACRQLAAWQQADAERAPQSVSVNVSWAELALGQRLVDSVRSALDSAQLLPHCLQIGVTERDVLRDRAESTGLMQLLSRLGVRLSMDEFGSGMTSLAGLRGHAFDTVKLDRSFVKGLGSNREVMALAHATLALIENLGLVSVAEGVEDTAQLAILQSLGCRYAQGRLLGEPTDGSRILAGQFAQPGSDEAELETAPASASAA